MSKILQNRTKYKLYILVLNNDRLDFYKTTYNITKLQLEFRTHRKRVPKKFGTRFCYV